MPRDPQFKTDGEKIDDLEEQLKALGAALDIANEQREAADRAKIEHWELRKQAERDAAKWKERCNNRTPEDVEAALKAYDGLAIAQQKEITYLRSERDKFKKACSDLAPYVPAADAANAKVERLRELVHQEECCEGTWDSDVDHYGCCEALRCSLGETGGDDGKTQEEADAKWNTRG